MSTLCIATRGYLNNTLAIATRGYICDQDDGPRGSGGYYRKGRTKFYSDEEERELLGVYDKGLESEIQVSKKPEKRLPKAVKIGSYTQTRDHSEYSLKEAENALKALENERIKAEQKKDEDSLLQILIHMQIFTLHCQKIRERDIVFIMAMMSS